MTQEKVTIRHPDAGIAQVPASAVDHWRSVGWLTEAEWADRKAADDSAAATAESEPHESPADEPEADDPPKAKAAPRRRQRGSEEND